MKTDDIKERVIKSIRRLAELDRDELRLAISDIVDDLASSRVSIRCKRSSGVSSPIPPYDPASDGDYSAWLVANNID